MTVIVTLLVLFYTIVVNKLNCVLHRHQKRGTAKNHKEI